MDSPNNTTYSIQLGPLFQIIKSKYEDVKNENNTISINEYVKT